MCLKGERWALRYEWVFALKATPNPNFPDLHKQRKSSIFGWLCSVSTMHEAITQQNLQAWMEIEWMHCYNNPSLSLPTCSFINPAGQPFVCANTRLAVCLLVHFPFFFHYLLREMSMSCDPIFRDFHLSWGDSRHWQIEVKGRRCRPGDKALSDRGRKMRNKLQKLRLIGV